MAEIVRMPKLSDTMTEGVVVEWYKKVGEKVESGDLLAEIETDKATMEFEAFQEGTLLHIGVEKGKGAAVDSILAILGEQNESIETLLAEEKNSTSAGSSNGAAVTPEKELASSAVASAAPQQTAVKETVAVAPSPAVTQPTSGRILASPLAKKLALDKGIDIQYVAGSGEAGRIIKRDIENYQPSQVASFAPVGQESFTEEPVSQMRKTIASRLSQSKFSAPHFYLTMEINMDQAMEARKMVNATGKVKISFNDLVVKAAAMALTKHPKVNSSWLNDKIRYNQHIHIGIAVAIEDGLLVPVVRHADTKNLGNISAEVKDLATKAKDRKLQPQDWEGNTFTISNLGMFGIEEFTAIINSPEACIMAVGGIKQTPVVKNGQVVPGNVMKVTLSCDHRVVDGALGAAFLQTFKEMLENPIMMIA